MDQDDVQITPGVASEAQSDVSTPSTPVSSQVFDISDDNISPISNEDLAAQPDVTPAPPPESFETEKRSTPPPDEELLDQKIGTFDASPFAPPAQIKILGTPDVRPVSSTDQKPTAPVVGLYPTRTPQQATPITANTRPAMPPTQPYREPLESQPSFQQVRPTAKNPAPIIPTAERARTLQEEISAALPNNLRGVRAPRPQPTLEPAPPPELVRPAQSRQPPESFQPVREVVKPVRTYEGDVAEAMSHKRTSTASIAIAESKKQQQRESVGTDESPTHAGRKISMLVAGLILLCGGAYGAYYLYSKSALAPVAPVAQQQKAAPSIIPSNSQTVVTIGNQSPAALHQRLLSEIHKPQAPDTITEIIITTKDSAGTLTRIPAPTMISNLDISAPDILSRSLTANWMLGVYNDPDNKKNTFVVVTTNFFQNAFAGMLQWEHVMADDLKQYLYPESAVGISNSSKIVPVSITDNVLNNINSILPTTGSSTTQATTTTSTTIATAKATSTSKTKLPPTATSTRPATTSTPENVAPLKEYVTIRGRFEDRIVKNKDVRAFRADNGTILFLYSFIDNSHLVVTGNESTLSEILNRLEKQSFIR